MRRPRFQWLVRGQPCALTHVKRPDPRFREPAPLTQGYASNTPGFAERDIPSQDSAMALSNAERQRRYRQKLKARASGEAAGDLVRAMAERATATLWALGTHHLQGPESAGAPPHAFAQDFAQFRAGLASQPHALIEACRQALAARLPLDAQDRHLLANLLEIDAALRLQAPPSAHSRVSSD